MSHICHTEFKQGVPGLSHDCRRKSIGYGIGKLDNKRQKRDEIHSDHNRYIKIDVSGVSLWRIICSVPSFNELSA